MLPEFSEILEFEHKQTVAECREWHNLILWLNGTPEQWLGRLEQHFIDGQLEILMGGKPTPEAREQLAFLRQD